MKDMKRLFGYMGPYKKDMILGALFVMIETGFELFIPIMISNLIDIGVANHDVNYIYVKGVQMALLALGALVTGLLYAHFSAKASYGWGAEIRKAEYARVQQYAFSNLDHFVTSSLITRMTTDVNVLQNMIISGFRPITRGPSLLIMGIGLSFYMNPKLAFVFVVCTPILAIILFLIVRKVAPMYTRLQSIMDRLNQVVQENLTAIRAVKAFVRDEYEEDKFEEVTSGGRPCKNADGISAGRMTMTVGMVPGASIAGMVFSLIVSFALPIGLFVYAKKKLGAKAAPFFIGCGVFFVMVLMLEAAIHRIVFQLAGEALTGSVILYAVYGGLMAALFEETGRYIAMRFLVKPLDFPNAFMYGAGHGGVEAMLLCGVASISNIVSAVMINSGTMSAQLATLDAEKAADTAAALSALWTTPSLTFFAGGVERIIAVVLHLSLSILVFQSIRKKAPMELVRAYLFHFVIDSLSVLLSAVASVWVVELVVALVTGGAVLMARYACMEE